MRETLAELYREISGETLPVATVRKFVADWLQTKEPEVSAGTLAFYKKSIAKFLEFLGTAADLDLLSERKIRSICLKSHKGAERGVRLLDRESIDTFMLALQSEVLSQ